MARLNTLWKALAILLVPLFLMGWAAQQAWRAESLLADARIMRQWTEHPDDALLEQLQGNEGKQVRMDYSSRRDFFNRRIAAIEADSGPLHLRAVLANVAWWLALAALLGGPAIWLRVRVDAWRARASRVFLYEHLSHSWQVLGQWLRGWLALVLAALSLALLSELSWGWSHRHDGNWLALMFCLPLVGTLYLGGKMAVQLGPRWRALQAPGSAFLGMPLARDTAPALWAWVEHLARRTGAPVPDHLVVGVDQSFFVTSVEVTLQPSGQVLSGRTLYLPLTYLSAMSQEEAAAVIGHELGHFSTRDTELGSETAARFQLMCEHYWALADEGEQPTWIERPVLWMAGRFLHYFQVAVHHWSRAQELVADRAGAAVAGEAIFGQALLRVIALAGVIDQLLQASRGDDLIRALGEHLRAHRLDLDKQAFARAVAHPFDTHPPTEQRLAHLKVSLDAELLAQATRAPTEHDRRWFNDLISRPASSPEGLPA